MKTRAMERDRKKAEAEAAAAAKRFKQPTPKATPGTSGEAMETETVSVVPQQAAPQPSTSTSSRAEQKSSKRTIEKVIDPDSGKDAPDPRRSNVPLNKGIKRLCLKSVLEFFKWLIDEAVRRINDPD